MMMAHDSTPIPPGLDEETIARVRFALRRYVREGDQTEELRDALHRMAAEARAKSIRAEQLLIILKGIWGSLPEVRYEPRTQPREKMLQELVTICIDQYYAS